MKSEHKIIREMLTKMIKPTARDILSSNLPDREFQAIYYADVEQEDLNYIADVRIKCAETTVKKYRKSGYEKLCKIYFPKN